MMKTGIILLITLSTISLLKAQPIRVGAKHFNEGYILSEVISQLLESEGYRVERNYNLGGTLVCFEALRNNEIDVYPEYSGTLAAEILHTPRLEYAKIDAALKQNFQLEIAAPYGFSNTYALVTGKDHQAVIKNISDLKAHPGLRLGLSYEFLKRQDGWDNLSQEYGLPHQAVGLEHGLAYQALEENKIDVTDAYSTDGEIIKYNLTVLEDDRHFFPSYEATSIYREGIPQKVKEILSRLSGKIDEKRMQRMNGAVLYEKKTFEQVAAAFLDEEHLSKGAKTNNSSVELDILQKTAQHLQLTFISLLLACLIAFPIGIWLYWTPRIANGVLYLTGLLQTIPSIALLAIMIPLFGIGTLPATVALFLYALLPILRNTLAGLRSVDPLLKRVAEGIGMTRVQKLRWVELPLATSTILAGIRTAAVINVGTATLAAFIGAGGLGEYIVTGLALNNTSLILRGAIPAAALALVVEFLFTFLERSIVPEHLR